MNRKVKTLYFSATDTTKKVVNGIAEGISPQFKEYSITLPQERISDLEFDSDDLVIAGVPVYAGRIPAIVDEYLSGISGKSTPVVCIAVYGNRDYEDALIELKNKLECNGFVGIAGGAFIGEHSYSDQIATNRPDNEDLKIARNFGAKIRRKLDTEEISLDSHRVSVRGSYPYKERPIMSNIGPYTDENCINCGICAKHCPVGAIDFKDFRKADPYKCIKCNSCIKRCPVNAKSIIDSDYIEFRRGLIERVAGKRSKIDLFI